MKHFLRFGAFALHPLLMPLLGMVIYYYVTPRFVDSSVIQSKVLAILIITLFVPIVTYFILKNVGWVTNIQLGDVRERKIPLMLQCLLVLLIIKTVFDPYDNPELYFFFVGILFSAFSALLLVLFRVKASLHQMGIAGVTMFVIALSIHFKVNILPWIALLLFANGWVASSRLSTRAHTFPEIVMGFVIGFFPQLIVLNLWL